MSGEHSRLNTGLRTPDGARRLTATGRVEGIDYLVSAGASQPLLPPVFLLGRATTYLGRWYTISNLFVVWLFDFV